jgi:hypothetical protein
VPDNIRDAAMHINEHRATPHISIDRYVKSRQVELGRSLDGRASVYLDTKFWIIVRDVAAGIRTDRAEIELLRLLRELTAAGKVFCPISETTFIELMKQADNKSRLETARLIDKLSLGVTLIPYDMRLATELAHVIHSFHHDRESLHPLHHLVWSKLTYVMGFVHPATTKFDSSTELAIQKAFFDHMWTISLEEVVELIGDTMPPASVDFAELAAKLNVGAAQHAAELRSFAQAYTAELRGVVDVCGNMIMQIVSDIAEKETGSSQPSGSVEWAEMQKIWKNLIFLALKKEPTRQQLRSMHIAAALHAAFRWDKARRFSGNDFYDFQHASAALAHCEAFFTEHSLHSMVTANHLALDKSYNCRVVSEVPEAVEYLTAAKTKPAS